MREVYAKLGISSRSRLESVMPKDDERAASF
jgi:hypothetical protein